MIAIPAARENCKRCGEIVVAASKTMEMQQQAIRNQKASINRLLDNPSATEEVVLLNARSAALSTALRAACAELRSVGGTSAAIVSAVYADLAEYGEKENV